MYNMSLKHVSLAGTVTVGQKGQIVIPVELREKMNIKTGDKLIALYIDDKKAMGFITEDAAKEMVDKMGEQMSALETVLKWVKG
jgi:AbrB family looped-hinge helix DNA binding protein